MNWRPQCDCRPEKDRLLQSVTTVTYTVHHVDEMQCKIQQQEYTHFIAQSVQRLHLLHLCGELMICAHKHVGIRVLYC